ncbi:hypothetical protein JAAARDRAFT_288936 [Jaapia argillacea MUCL 33604]|uniref:Copper-fist domain-containing protein n=1 Tax=Jaapia argillacea MUCL 33604 TaxID=933084 RepID=A0A067PTQ5_9AGAM|nr:hypothetical protein JAAARDRAFT_288936 [Jaapia argillacea MUCL 33604]
MVYLNLWDRRLRCSQNPHQTRKVVVTIDPGHFTILKPASAAAHQAIAERPLTRRLSDGSNDDLGAIHEMNARNHPHLRRVLPRLSSGHAIPTGAGHETSSHVVSAPHHSSHHGNMFYSPYGRAYESTHVDPSPEASPECVAPHIDQSGVPPERFRPFPAATSASSSPQFSQPPFGTVTSWNQNQLANNFEESTRPYTSPSSQTLPSKDPFIPTFDISAIDEWMSQLPDFAMQASDTNNPSPPLGDVDPAIVQAFFASWNDNVYSVPTTGTEPPDGGWYGGNDKCAAGQCRCIGDWCGQGREGVESPSRNSVTFAVSGERAPCASEKGSLTGNFSSSRPEEANRAAFVVNIPLPRNHSGTADRLHLSIEPRQSFSRASSTSSSHSSQPSSHGSFGSVDYANIPESHSFDSIPGMAFIDEFDPSNSKARTFS